MTMIDRSNVNGTDNYAEAKKAGVTHVYLKASEGTTFTDATYDARRAAAHAAGLVTGAYHFAGSGSPVAEADHFLGIIGTPKAGHLRPCLDLESGQSAAWAAAFVEHVHAKLGYWPVLYGNTSEIPALRSANASVRACPWWRAEYGPNDGAQHTLSGGAMGAAAHQYTSAARFAGINGDTDASVFLDEKAMLVPTATKPRKKWRKPDHYELHYTDVYGDRQVIKTTHPGIWEHRHQLARRRPPGISVIPKFKP